MTVLSRREIEALLAARPPLLEGLVSREEQLQPNGVDLTLGEVALLAGPGQVGAAAQDRVLSALSPLAFDGLGYMTLAPGCYLVTFNEVVRLPRWLMALGKPRSSLLRCGVAIHNAVWDAGYEGRSQALMVVYNPLGFRLQRQARVLQLVFLRLGQETEGYQGRFQGENL